MERISRITIGLVVGFVLVGLISNEVQGDPRCMSQCNKKCLESQKTNSKQVSCGVACFVECMDWGNKKGLLSPEMEKRLEKLKKRLRDGNISQEDVDEELKHITQHMMTITESAMHEHDHKTGEKPVKAPHDFDKFKEEKDITEDDDEPEDS